jgi:hypothetical protein
MGSSHFGTFIFSPKVFTHQRNFAHKLSRVSS